MAQRANRISLFLPKAEADALREQAKRRGFIIHSGQNIGEGSVSAFLRALARSALTMNAVEEDDNPSISMLPLGPSARQTLAYAERLNDQIMANLARHAKLATQIEETRRENDQIRAKLEALAEEEARSPEEVAHQQP